jgi:hypothetical protein
MFLINCLKKKEIFNVRFIEKIENILLRVYNILRMPLNHIILDQLKCCLSNDGHIIIQPVLLKCGGNACQECFQNSDKLEIKCYCCNKNHLKKDLLDSPFNKIADLLVQTSLKDLFEYLEINMKSTIDSLKGFFYFNYFKRFF